MDVFMSYDVSRRIANPVYRSTVNMAVEVAKEMDHVFIHTNLATGNRYALIPAKKHTFQIEKNKIGDYFVKEV